MEDGLAEQLDIRDRVDAVTHLADLACSQDAGRAIYEQFGWGWEEARDAKFDAYMTMHDWNAVSAQSFHPLFYLRSQ